ncbi:MAG: HIT family protein [Candidatus Babeliales bacterium]
MHYLYAPWRDDYAKLVRNNFDGGTSCVFCTQFNENNDTKNWIIKRFKRTVIMLNKYPYNAGHILVLPHAHGGDIFALSPDIRAELMEAATMSMQALKKLLNPPAFNMGLNLGKESGGSVTDHLHMHVLPRFTGDTNFLPVCSNTKVISTDVDILYTKLKNLFDGIE